MQIMQIIYRSPYRRLFWDYKKANTNLVQKALNTVDWNRLFSNANVEKQVNIMNETLFNIFHTLLEVKSLQLMAKIHHG